MLDGSQRALAGCVVLPGIVAQRDPHRLDRERQAEPAFLADQLGHGRAERLAEHAFDAHEVLAVLAQQERMGIGGGAELPGEDRAEAVGPRLAPRPVGEQVAGGVEAVVEGDRPFAQRRGAVAGRGQFDAGAEQVARGEGLRQQHHAGEQRTHFGSLAVIGAGHRGGHEMVPPSRRRAFRCGAALGGQRVVLGVFGEGLRRAGEGQRARLHVAGQHMAGEARRVGRALGIEGRRAVDELVVAADDVVQAAVQVLHQRRHLGQRGEHVEEVLLRDRSLGEALHRV
ncbi:hypothetical protein D3C76_880050 [compost metagenome]